MISSVVALYVDPKGPYPKLVSEWYDAARDARTYEGSKPVIAHPPCGAWGMMKHLSNAMGKEQEPTFALHAIEVVRRNGGVLEHPRGSALFEHEGLPLPGNLPDAYGGVTYEVCQCDWGHPARKRTWLYVVRVAPEMFPEAPEPREPTHWASGSRTAPRGAVPPGIKVCSVRQRRRTPEAFARWLIEVASNANNSFHA